MNTVLITGCSTGFGFQASQVLAARGDTVYATMRDPEVPTDPIDVVNRFVELIDMTPGTRPFRSAVGVDLGVIERNRSDEAHDAPFLEAMGLTDFVKLKVT